MYRHILVTVDLTGDSDVVTGRALELARRLDARLSLLHVVEYIPVDPAGEALLPPPVDMEQELVDSARQRLETLCRRLELDPELTRIEVGSIKSEICRVAREVEADLIVLGSHERHGLALLLGSTERSVVHSAPCDVLAVRLH